MNYYAIPFDVGEVMRGKTKVDEIDLRESIHQNIRLILKTFSLSYRYDPTFGSVMNKYQASTPPQKRSERAWREAMREEIQKNLKDMLQRYETRIKVSDVEIEMKSPKGRDRDVVNVMVQIMGQLTLGRRDQFHFPDSEVEGQAREVFPLMIPVGK